MRNSHLAAIWQGKSGGLDLWRGLVEGNFLLSHTPLIPLRLAKEAGGFDEDRGLSGCEDYDFWLRLTRKNCDFIYLDEVPALYRQMESSVSHDLTGQELRTIRVLERTLETADLNQVEREAVLRYLVDLNVIVGYRFIRKKELSRSARCFYKAFSHKPERIVKPLWKYYFYMNLRDGP